MIVSIHFIIVCQLDSCSFTFCVYCHALFLCHVKRWSSLNFFLDISIEKFGCGGFISGNNECLFHGSKQYVGVMFIALSCKFVSYSVNLNMSSNCYHARI